MNKNSMISNLVFHMKMTKKWNTRLFYAQIFYFLPCVMSSFLAIYLSAYVVRGLTEKYATNVFIIKLLLLGMLYLISSVVSAGLYQFIYRNGMALTMYYDIQCFQCVLNLPFKSLENKDIIEKKNRAWNILRNEYGIRNSVVLLPNLFSLLIEVIVFGCIMTSKNFFLVGICCVYLLLNMVIFRKIEGTHGKYHASMSQLSSQIAFVSRETMNKAAAADLRIYKMQEWILRKYDQALQGIAGIYQKIHDTYFYRSIMDGGFQFVVQVLVYGYLIRGVFNDRIRIDEFVLLITAFRRFLEALKKFIEQLLALVPVHTSINYIRDYIEMAGDTQEQSGIMYDKIKNIENIEFRNVSFRYPNSSREIIRNMNLKIQKGEKIAVLGLNGMGKTTFVKLLCGLYEPTEGEILINGISMNNISTIDRNRIFSALFQNSEVLPLNIMNNICGDEVVQETEKLKDVLVASDFRDKYEKLPQRGKTLLVKEVNSNATDLSGGEKQKLLFARVLYKNAEVLLLDEPTSALDPVAENKLYKQFADATDGKTVFFISHRMASTRFCDRIVLLDNGCIIETGTHDHLMKSRGQYYELYETQSKYYRKSAEETGNVSISNE